MNIFIKTTNIIKNYYIKKLEIILILLETISKKNS